MTTESTRRVWLRGAARQGAMLAGGAILVRLAGEPFSGSSLLADPQTPKSVWYIVETPGEGDRIEVSLVPASARAASQPDELGPGERRQSRPARANSQPRTSEAPPEVGDCRRMIVAVHSARGIGSAVITRRAPAWPGSLLIRWHLRGLESFDLVTERGRLSGAIGQDPAGLRSRLWRDGREDRLLQPDEPWYAPISVCQSRLPAAHPAGAAAADPEPRLPLENGYFELLIPAGLLAGNPSRLELRWVDFHR